MKSLIKELKKCDTVAEETIYCLTNNNVLYVNSYVPSQSYIYFP